MSDNLFDALEDCLSAVQRGDDIESCLARHPDLISDLRPLLAAAVGAEALAVQTVPAEAARRGKSRLLNQAAELRERAGASTGATSPIGFRLRHSFRLTLSAVAALLFAFVLGGVGLVFAASASLPGDRLYPVKIRVEDLQLRLASNAQARATLEDHFQTERLGEVSKLINIRRAEDVKFFGPVTGIFPDRIIVSDIVVLLTPQTKIDGTLDLDVIVKVEGATQPDGSIRGSQISVLIAHPQGSNEDSGGGNSGSGGASGSGSGSHSGSSGGSGSSGESTPQTESFDLEGKVSSLSSGSIVVSGKIIVLNNATEIRGTLAKGVTVRARGFIGQDGKRVATRVEVTSTGGGDNGGDDDEGSNHATATPTPNGGGSGSGDGDDGGGSNQATATPTPDGGGSGSSGGSTPQAQTFDLEGKITSLNNGSIVVAGKSIVLTDATEIRGNLAEGVTVRARGTIGAGGNLVATRVEVVSTGGD